MLHVILLYFRYETSDMLALSSINDLQFGSYYCVLTSGTESVRTDKVKVVCGIPIDCKFLFVYLYNLVIYIFSFFIASKTITQTQTDQRNGKVVIKI